MRGDSGPRIEAAACACWLAALAISATEVKRWFFLSQPAGHTPSIFRMIR